MLDVPVAERANTHNNRKVTIFFSSGLGFGYAKMEARLHVAEFRPYAQYSSVPYIEYTRKRKRTRTGSYRSDHRVVIVDGWGHTFQPESMWSAPRQDTAAGVTVRDSKRMAFDPGWDNQFNSDLAESGLEIVFDGRKEGTF